jgi:hypothetical protein
LAHMGLDVSVSVYIKSDAITLGEIKNLLKLISPLD